MREGGSKSLTWEWSLIGGDTCSDLYLVFAPLYKIAQENILQKSSVLYFHSEKV